MGEIETITFQFNILTFMSFRRPLPQLSSIRQKLILNCLQELINNLLNLQTTYRKSTFKSYQNFITDIVKLKKKQFLGVNILIKQRSISFDK